MTKLEKNLLENTLFSNELALHNVEVTKCFMKLADDDPNYLQTKHSIEVVFEKHKQEYKELTGTDYINLLK